MKKALSTILSLTLLLPHHSFAMQEQSPKEIVKLSFGSGTIYPNPYGSDVQPSTVNQKRHKQDTETISLIEKINEAEVSTDEENQPEECGQKISSTLWYATAGTFVAIVMTGILVGFYFRALAQK